MLPFILGGIVILIALGMVAVGIANANRADPLAERLADFAGQTELAANLEDIELSIPFSQRIMMPIFQTIARIALRFTPTQTLESTQRQLDLAGNPSNLTPPLIIGMRVVGSVGLGLLLNLVLVTSKKSPAMILLGTLGGSVFGFMLPVMWLRSKIERRQQAVIKGLPDALDLMVICVEAGLGFDAAMTKVYEKWENEIALAFGRVIREIQLGKSRREALRSMADRLDVPDVTSFTAAIIQADQLGVSIATVLRVQAEQMRIKRRQRAEEQAQQAPVKIMIPLALFILPSIWIVTLGPALVRIYKAFTSGAFRGLGF